MYPIPESQLQPGQVIGGHYQIVRLLGRGAFGETYLAENRHFSIAPECAIKLLRPRSHDEQVLQKAKELFERETVVLYRLGRHDRIPRLLAHFEDQGEFYLVEEFVEGSPLNRELVPGNRVDEAEVVELVRDVLEVLDFVHQERVIHRDIKPSNLIRRQQDGKLVLIDFGAVSELGALGTEGQARADSTSIGTRGYVPAEQFNGVPVYGSDIYAVGIIGIQALTGMNPLEGLPAHARTGEIVWRDRAQVSAWFAAILEKMVRRDHQQRYQSAAAALQALQQNPVQLAPTSLKPTLRSQTFAGTDERSRRKRLLGVGALAAIVTAILIGFIYNHVRLSLETAGLPQPLASEDRFSYGEELLLERTTSKAKLEGIDAFSKGNYRKAILNLKLARKELSADPETLIYLNNAWLAEQRAKADTIAVAVPISRDPNQAGEILRGVAQAQHEFHWGEEPNSNTEFDRERSLRKRGLQILIVDDANGERSDGENADAVLQSIAQTLGSESGILAVIGHTSSDATLSVAEIYQQHQLVLMSATSTAVALSKKGKTNPYLFRTVPNDRVTAQKLVEYLSGQKVALFYNPESQYSQSLHDAFRDALFPVATFELSDPRFDAYADLDAAAAAGADALVLFPDLTTRDRAIEILKANRNHPQLSRPFQFLAGGDSLYTYDPTLTDGGQAAAGLVVSVPWHHLDSPNPTFAENAKHYWGEASWRTAMAYDAVQTLLAALERLADRDRNSLQHTLAAKGFTATGATDRIGFDNSGDRSQDLGTLVRIVSCQGELGVRFVPLKSATQVENLACVSE